VISTQLCARSLLPTLTHQSTRNGQWIPQVSRLQSLRSLRSHRWVDRNLAHDFRSRSHERAKYGPLRTSSVRLDWVKGTRCGHRRALTLSPRYRPVEARTANPDAIGQQAVVVLRCSATSVRATSSHLAIHMLLLITQCRRSSRGQLPLGSALGFASGAAGNWCGNCSAGG
jgi:hypothetical protein